MSDSIDLEFEDEAGAQAPLVESPYEVVDEATNDPFGGKKPEEILAELKAKEAEAASLKAQADSAAALAGSFAALGDRLEKVVSRPVNVPLPASAPGPTESEDAFKERMRQKLLEDPVAAIVESVGKYYGGVMGKQSSALTAISKQTFMLDPDNKSLYQKYGAEIEAHAAQFAGSPTAYQDAADKVKAAHFSEMQKSYLDAEIDKRVAEVLAQRGLSLPSQPSSSSQGPQAPRAHVELAAAKPTQRAAGVAGKPRVTTAQIATWTKVAQARGFDVKDYIESQILGGEE